MDNSAIFLAVLQGLPWTIGITLGSFILGALLGVPICAMRISKNRVISAAASYVILILRSIPPIVWLFLLFFGFGTNVYPIDPVVAAILGLGLITAANLAEVYRGALKAVPKGQFEATSVIGLSTWQKYVYVIVPQVFLISLPSASTYGIGLLKDTAIASTIGVPEIAQVANHISQQTFRGLGVFAIAATFYFTLSFIMAWFSRKLDLFLRLRYER